MAATHALPPAPPVARPRVLVVGTAFATAATVMVFIALVGIYLSARAGVVAAGDPWLPQGVAIPLQQPNTMLFTMLLSSMTMQWAVSAIAKDDRVNAYLALALTFVFGIAVITMTTYLYTLMNLDITTGVQGVLIYTITGGQLLMLAVAMVFLALMAFRALGGQFTSRQHDGMSAAALFWHGAVAVYVLIWIAIYVTK